VPLPSDVDTTSPKYLRDKYGIVGVGETVGQAFRITSMIEKPKPAAAPSNLFINGRYILQPDIFALLGEHRRGVAAPRAESDRDEVGERHL